MGFFTTGAQAIKNKSKNRRLADITFFIREGFSVPVKVGNDFVNCFGVNRFFFISESGNQRIITKEVEVSWEYLFLP